MEFKPDRYDRMLLAAVQQNSQMPQSEMGERVGLSTAAVNRRLRVLKSEGVIERYAACINPKAVGYGLTIVVEVKAESERADLLNELRESFKACPQIQQCYYVTGEFDFLLIFLVRDMEQYVQWTHQLFLSNNNVKTFKTVVVMDRVKTGMQVTIDR
ncbi:Lrp/AsnC family transcriptional regulator [Pseudomonas juntendi]|uniref:Lrp/AsnC family transcriptional regulator n=1 Tax=Pseudomonas juntendi TaxID=2666183 RepID=A0A7W2LY29_9PSED|nr:Lrp/AsnC family transcriptional regulator [Pseudomonas juntendi]MBA6133882.1 Lrp/AsnC family transcriptional regulator [Pseudomonas juntendi]MBA6149190.1 Lrp/AsnC family transcriptional regulator [Pseudomonas juntendi]